MEPASTTALLHFTHSKHINENKYLVFAELKIFYQIKCIFDKFY